MLALGAVYYFAMNRTMSGILLIFIGGLVISLGGLVEWAKNKKSLKGTSIDFTLDKKDYIYKFTRKFLDKEDYEYDNVTEDFKLMKGHGFEIKPSGVRLVVFGVKGMSSGKVARLGIRNVDETNQQEAIKIQVKLDELFRKKGMRGKNPQDMDTRYQWDGEEYRPMQ